MRIERFCVKNYKSFAEGGGEGTLAPGINVVIGQNNVGKTALLEAISVRMEGDAGHRSSVTHPTADAVVKIVPTVELDVRLEEREILEILADRGGHFVVTSPPNGVAVETSFLPAIRPNGVFRLTWGPNPRSTLLSYPYEDSNPQHFDIARPDLELRRAAGGSTRRMESVIQEEVPRLIYLFGAERFNVGQRPVGTSRVLAPNALNLPEVVNLLQSDPAGFEELNGLVSRVLPQVRWISAEAVQNNEVRLLVWAVDPHQSRRDLAVPLARSGTGVGQVLAILYVVTQASHPQVIVIDEPQTFLHPGAVRKLFEILREYPQHQFIISTHSPTALTAADSGAVLLVRQADGVSSVQPSSITEAKSARTILADLGVRLEDVFGFDRVLWVEGKTEELCFPIVLRDIAKRRVAGTAIVGLTATGDFETRHANLAFAIYRQLTQGTPLIPPTVAFAFDRERRTAAQVTELIRRAGGLVHFLPRRMYENYLLDPDAIASVVAEIEGFGQIDAAAVRTWIDANRWNDGLFRPGAVPAARTEEDWLVQVHGGHLLERLFSDLSERRVAYDKAKHGVALTERVARDNPTALQPLADFLSELIPD